MSTLPTLPTSPGLICQGWNWTLQQIKDYVASYSKCEIGAVYTTDDGKTRIKITIQDPKYTTIPIVFKQTAANGVKVNWGDGSTEQTYSSTSQQTIRHTYASFAYPAAYTITFEVVSGTMSFPTYIMGMSNQSNTIPRDAFLNMIDEVNIGSNVTSIGNYVFQYCQSLASVTIPSSVTTIGTYLFSGCNSLASITIPSSVTSISSRAFSSCNSLASITIPSSVTSIDGNAFQYCYGMKTFDFRRSTSVPTLNNVNAFNSTPSDKEIIVPDELYESWKAASNWSSTTNNIVKASESSLGPLN